jgi:hypothetical protein
MIRKVTFASLAWLGFLCACSGAVAPLDGNPDGGGSGTCATDADCGQGKHCGFPVASACSATGTCFVDVPGGVCEAYSPGCACDGTDLNLVCNGFPDGYAPKPVAFSGPCGSDGGIVAGPCTSNADCTTGYECGFLISEACSAAGTCVRVDEGVRCNSYEPGCTCSGTTINVACNGYPSGYAPQPVLHTGVCEGIDASAGTFACGSLSCHSGTQICQEGVGGPAGSQPTFTCASLPSQCATNATCGCVQSAVGAQLCSADASGNITVTFEYP